MHKNVADLEVDPSRSLNCSRGAVPCFGYEQWPLRLRLRALALQKGTAKRIIDVYLSIKVYVAPSALSVREKNQVEPETLREDVQEHSGVLKCVKWFSMFWFYLCDS